MQRVPPSSREPLLRTRNQDECAEIIETSGRYPGVTDIHIRRFGDVVEIHGFEEKVFRVVDEMTPKAFFAAINAPIDWSSWE
jgi:hypothetical protein